MLSFGDFAEQGGRHGMAGQAVLRFRLQKYLKTACRSTLFDERGRWIDENGASVDLVWRGWYFVVSLQL